MKLTQRMEFEKETKRTLRFKDPNPNSKCPVIYVNKSAFPARPKGIIVNIESEE